MKLSETYYILADNCKVLTLDEIQKKSLPQALEVEKLLKQELFALDDGITWHLINPAIKSFLEQFQQTNSLAGVIKYFAQAANCSEAEISKTMRAFFESMVHRRFLTPIVLEQPRQTAPKRAFPAGKLIGPYRIIRRIFFNHKIDIYRAEETTSHELVAIKALKINPAIKQKEQNKQRQFFLQEFELLQQIGFHPNICQLKAVVQQKDYCFGVLELLDDISIRRHLISCRPSLRERLRLIQQLLSAMAHVHHQGIIHGDLHISNILVHQGKELKLIDFNMANRQQPAAQEIVHYGGVYQYIAPEKVDSRAFHIVNSPADCCSEVFQLGVVIYYVMYEKMPFEAFSWSTLAQQILEKEPEFPSLCATKEFIPKSLLNMIKRALTKQPEQRFASAEKMYSHCKTMVKYPEYEHEN